MTSHTSPRAFRLNISRFWENYSFHEKEEYHLLDNKIKAFFSSIIEGFIHEPLHFWFFKTHFYPFKKKKKFAKVFGSNDFKYRLVDLNIKKNHYSILRKKSLTVLKHLNKSNFILIKNQSSSLFPKKFQTQNFNLFNYKHLLNKHTVLHNKHNFSTFVRKHILRALYGPALLKLNKLPLNFSLLNSFHYYALSIKGKHFLNRNFQSSPTSYKKKDSKKPVKQAKSLKKTHKDGERKTKLKLSRKEKIQKLTKKERILFKRLKQKQRKLKKQRFLNISPHRLYLTYKSNLRTSNPIILGKCKVFKSTSIILVQLFYYLDLDQHYTSEISTLLVYRLLASKHYLERVLHLKIKLHLTNYFLFIWKYNLFTGQKTGHRTKKTTRPSSASNIFELTKLNEILKKKQRKLFHFQNLLKKIFLLKSFLYLLKKNTEHQSKTLLPPVTAFSPSPYVDLENQLLILMSEFSKSKNLKTDNVVPTNDHNENLLFFNSLKHHKTLFKHQITQKKERNFFLNLQEHLHSILTNIERWRSNRFFKRTFNMIMAMFFYEFDQVLIGNLLSFELNNLRKGHGRYLYFFKKILDCCFNKHAFLTYRLSTNRKTFLNSLAIHLKGRITKSRRPSTRTQTITLKIPLKPKKPTSQRSKSKHSLTRKFNTLNSLNSKFNTRSSSLSGKNFTQLSSHSFNLLTAEQKTLLLQAYIFKLFKLFYFFQVKFKSYLTQPDFKHTNQTYTKQFQFIQSLLKLYNLYFFSQIPDHNVQNKLVMSLDQSSLKNHYLFLFKLLLNNNNTTYFDFQQQIQKRFWQLFFSDLDLMYNKHQFNFYTDFSSFDLETNNHLLSHAIYLSSDDKIFFSNHLTTFNIAALKKHHCQINHHQHKTILTKKSKASKTLTDQAKFITTDLLKKNNPITRADSYETISYNRFGIINIEVVVFYNH